LFLLLRKHPASLNCISHLSSILFAGLLLIGIGSAVAEETGQITGTVADASGNPVANVGVYAHYWNSDWWDWDRSGATDAAGQYTIGGLASGTYRVCFDEYNTGNYLRECHNDAPDVDSADDVAVTGGKHHHHRRGACCRGPYLRHGDGRLW